MMRDIPSLYHISFDRKLPLTLIPREPWGSELQPDESTPQKESADPDAWIFAEFKTPRVSFSPSLLCCVQAVYANTHHLFQSPRGLKEGLEFAVYRYDPRSKARIMFPEDLSKKRAVWDAHITKEHCFLDPVQIYYCGTFVARVEKDIPGMMVHPFNDKSMKEIKSVVPHADDLTFKQTLRLRGDKYQLQFF
jgi:hypothetical protein